MHITIQSFGRPSNVPLMHQSLGHLEPTWYVPESQASDYEKQGAIVYPVKEQPFPMKTHQLNSALDQGFERGDMVVCMDDDFKYCRIKENEHIPLATFIEQMGSKLEHSRFFIAGITNISNAFWISGKVREYGNLPGAITIHKPNKIRYDTNLKMLEDLDVCIQHHVEHGGIIRDETAALKFEILSVNKKHTQEGGYGRSREKLQKSTLTYMQEKFNSPFITFPLDSAPGENVHGQILWPKFVRAENTLDKFS